MSIRINRKNGNIVRNKTGIDTPVKIEGTADYSYRGHTLGRYESATGGVRWMVEFNGKELVADYHSLWAVQDYVDQHR